ncbi:MAG: hypothetical protein LBV76_06415 [Deltaproteobacteria bacterium]|nr:hypothetical protein [Deltaproteobacteria bacterium]
MKNSKFIGIAGALLLIVILYVCFGRGGISESDVIKRTEKELALVQPWLDFKVDKISADTSVNAITFTGVSISSKDFEGFVLKVESIVESGIDDNSYKGEPGDITSIKSLDYNNISFIYNGQQVATIAKYTQEQLALRYKEFLKFLGENAAKADTDKLIAHPLYKDYSVGRVYAKDLKADIGMVTASIKEIEGKDVTLTKYGPGFIADLQVSVMGNKVFGLDKFSFASCSLPAFISEAIADPEKFLQNNQEFSKKFENDRLAVLSPFEIKNFSFDNLMVDTGAAPVTLKQLKGDFSLIEGNLKLSSSLDDLLLSRAFISSNSELKYLAPAVKEDLHLNADLNLLLDSKKEPVDIAVRTVLKEKNLGGFSVDIAGDMPKQSLYRKSDDAPRLKSLDFAIVDTGLIDFILAGNAAMEESSLDKEQILAMLEAMGADGSTPLLQKTLSAIASLIKSGGTLNVSLKPEKILIWPDDFDFETLDQKGYSITYKPR